MWRRRQVGRMGWRWSWLKEMWGGGAKMERWGWRQMPGKYKNHSSLESPLWCESNVSACVGKRRHLTGCGCPVERVALTRFSANHISSCANLQLLSANHMSFFFITYKRGLSFNFKNLKAFVQIAFTYLCLNLRGVRGRWLAGLGGAWGPTGPKISNSSRFDSREIETSSTLWKIPLIACGQLVRWEDWGRLLLVVQLLIRKTFYHFSQRGEYFYWINVLILRQAACFQRKTNNAFYS